jgi:hypothetical protein
MATNARRLRDSLEPIAQQGASARPVRQRLKELGLGGIEGYVWGRAAALGEPAPWVVVSAFGVFEPSFVVRAYESARAKASRQDVLDARAAGAAESLATVLGTVTDVEWAADLLVRAVSDLDATGRPLFSGLRALPVPEDPYGRLWRGADLVREHRGDGHLAACIAAGLDVVEMNVLTELWIGYAPGEYTVTRGHSPVAIDRVVGVFGDRGWWDGAKLTSAGREVRDGIEAATDASQVRLVENLGDDIERVIETLSTMAVQMIEAGAFTDDPRKRAAG